MENFTYLRNNSWAQITREERYYCAELYFDIKDNPKFFVEFLNKKLETDFNINQHWEVGYEVCFYRDYLFSIDEPVKPKYHKQKYPQKRTFDLCLFSDNDIIIIEAKADQNFSKSQMKSVKKDNSLLTRLLEENGKVPSISTFLLCASTNKQEIEGFQKFFWNDLSEIYNNTVYKTADGLHKRRKKKKDIWESPLH